jgi:hypothetical protein
MSETVILRIIELSLELALKIREDIPKEHREAFWTRHNDRMEFWHGLLFKARDTKDGA